MERCDDASSSPAMVNNTDKSLLCHHHHHGCRRSSHSDDDVIAWGQRVTRSIDGKDVASGALAQRVDLATCTLCSGSDHSQSGPIRCCSDGQEVEHLNAAACWCGGRANNHHLDQPTCSAPPSQHMDPVTSPLDEDEGEVNFDLEQVSSDDDAFTESPPGQLRHPTTSPATSPTTSPAPAPRYRNTYECVRRQSAPGQLVQVNAGPESELQSRRPDIAEYFSG